MGGFKKVISTKDSQQSSSTPTASQPYQTLDEQKDEVIQKCYEKFLEFPIEEQSRVLQIIQPHPTQPIKEKDQIYDIINFLIEKDKSSLNINLRQRINYIANQPKYEIIIRVFESKFASMTKSKEEMIKFCMRKAFKFVYDKIVNEKKQKLNKKEQKHLKNEYFGITNETEYALPFRDDSAEKTMNDDFLKKTFALKNFMNDYKIFLDHYDEILEKDNQKKIHILVDQILETPELNFEQELQKIKRIPWSRDILEQTKQLAVFLLQKYGTINEQLINNRFSSNLNENDQGNNLFSTNVKGECDDAFNKLNNSSLNKSKQSIISFNEFKGLMLNITKNSGFKNMMLILTNEFIKPDNTQLNNQDVQSIDCFLKKEDSQFHLKFENIDFTMDNHIMIEEPLISKDSIKLENLGLHSPEINFSLKEKLLSNPKTIETKFAGENKAFIKEEFNENTHFKTQKDCTPDPSLIKNKQSTTQFSISPISNSSNMFGNNSNTQNKPINQQNTTKDMSLDPFSLVNISNFSEILNNQSQFSTILQQTNRQLQNQNVMNSFMQKNNNNFQNGFTDAINTNQNQMQQNMRENNINRDSLNIHLQQLLAKELLSQNNNSIFTPPNQLFSPQNQLYSSNNEALQPLLLQLLLCSQDFNKNSAQQQNLFSLLLNLYNMLSPNQMVAQDENQEQFVQNQFRQSQQGQQINQLQMGKELDKINLEQLLQSCLSAQTNYQTQQNQN